VYGVLQAVHARPSLRIGCAHDVPKFSCGGGARWLLVREDFTTSAASSWRFRCCLRAICALHGMHPLSLRCILHLAALSLVLIHGVTVGPCSLSL
jgi:hypothetical protein